MEPLLIEFPITKVKVICGIPDTIIFETNMIASSIDDQDVPQLPTLMMTVPKGTGQNYVLKQLEIPEDYVEIIGGK